MMLVAFWPWGKYCCSISAQKTSLEVSHCDAGVNTFSWSKKTKLFYPWSMVLCFYVHELCQRRSCATYSLTFVSSPWGIWSLKIIKTCVKFPPVVRSRPLPLPIDSHWSVHKVEFCRDFNLPDIDLFWLNKCLQACKSLFDLLTHWRLCRP